MLASVHSASVLGVDAHPVLVEVDVARGLPAWSIVGLASNAVEDSRERVCAALVNSGFDVPARRTTVSLSPDSQARQGRAATRRPCERGARRRTQRFLRPLPPPPAGWFVSTPSRRRRIAAHAVSGPPKLDSVYS